MLDKEDHHSRKRPLRERFRESSLFPSLAPVVPLSNLNANAPSVDDRVSTHGAPTASFSERGWVRLNVSGVRFLTHESTLLNASSSALAAHVRSGWCDALRDDNGLPFIEADPELFRIVLNFLRGYSIVPPPSRVEDLVELSLALGIPELAVHLGISPEDDAKSLREHHTFYPQTGPGISENGTVLSSHYVAMLLDPPAPLEAGRYEVKLRVKNITQAGVGVLHCPEPARFSTTRSFAGAPLSALYMMSGHLHYNPSNEPGQTAGLPEPRSALAAAMGRSSNLPPLLSGDSLSLYVTVAVDRRSASIEFLCEVSGTLTSLPPVTLSGPPDEADQPRQLALRIALLSIGATHLILEGSTFLPDQGPEYDDEATALSPPPYREGAPSPA